MTYNPWHTTHDIQPKPHNLRPTTYDVDDPQPTYILQHDILHDNKFLWWCVTLQPEAFCAKHKLPPPQKASARLVPAKDIFLKLATMAAFPWVFQPLLKTLLTFICQSVPGSVDAVLPRKVIIDSLVSEISSGWFMQWSWRRGRGTSLASWPGT